MKSTLQHERCTGDDYRRLFAGSAERLGWLCYTLTGNEELSGRVLDAALEQSLKGSDHVFREWMVSWARRLIIRACIETVQPRTAAFAQATYPLPPLTLDSVNRDHLALILSLPSELLQERLLRLDALSRFVFVLRVFEGYSRRETSLLLNIDDRACEWIYVRAAGALHAEAEQHQSLWANNRASQSDFCLAQAGD
jgi:DNA-directed RNA polymerase specialized sigma24 family protein